MKEVYKRLKKEYLMNICDERNRQKCNPPKNNFEIGFSDGIVTKSTNVMSAQTERGVFTKVISIDDVSGKVKESIIYTDNDLNVYHYDDIGLTVTRCALMACLAADLNCRITSRSVVGFIGNGRINLKTCEMFHTLFGVRTFVIRGSEADRAKHQEMFCKFGTATVDFTEDLALLNMCDVVICCTNSYKESELIDSCLLEDPELIISQDGGYLLGESFRKTRICFTDHIEQLSAHYASEFPFDKEAAKLEMMTEARQIKGKKSVYLYGIALADAIVFEELYLSKEKKQ